MNRLFFIRCLCGIVLTSFIVGQTQADWIQDGGSLNINPSMQASSPTIAIYNGSPYVAWTESNGVTIQLYVKHYNGSSWVQDAGSLNVNTSQHAFSPQIAFANEVLHVVWRESNGANDLVCAKRFNGIDWSVADTLNIDNSKNAVLPSLAVYDDIAYVTWQEAHTSTSVMGSGVIYMTA